MHLALHVIFKAVHVCISYLLAMVMAILHSRGFVQIIFQIIDKPGKENCYKLCQNNKPTLYSIAMPHLTYDITWPCCPSKHTVRK